MKVVRNKPAQAKEYHGPETADPETAGHVSGQKSQDYQDKGKNRLFIALDKTYPAGQQAA